jgi:predicted cupin superfamily sugar epimerase
MQGADAGEVTGRTVIEKLELKPHPEGGWFREIHRSGQSVRADRGIRAAITAIYYLLERDQISRWHVVDSDEIWHFHQGAPLELLAYDPRQRLFNRHVLGSMDGQCQVAVVPRGVWQAARSLGRFSLVGCDVGPGFDFADFGFVSAVLGHEKHFVGDLNSWSSLL